MVRLQSPGFDGEFEVAPGVKARVEGKVKVIQGIAPGSVAVSCTTATGPTGPAMWRLTGCAFPATLPGAKLVPNPAMAVDAYLKDVSLTDYIAGDSVFTGTRVRLVKVGHDITHVPPGAYMSMGPRMALLSPDDPAHAQEVARRALEVARRGGGP